LRFQIDELEAAALERGEDERVAQERERLRHAEKLLERVSGALRLLSAGDEGGAVDGLRVAERLVSEAAGHDAALAEVAGRLASLTAEGEEALATLQAYLDELDLDPAHRDAVELRHDRLQTLKRKYRLATSDELIAYAEEAQQRLAALETAEHDESELAAALEQARAAAVAAAAKLSAARAAPAPGFAAAVEAELRALAMPHARFEVALTPRAPRAGAAPDESAAVSAGAYDALGPRGAEEAEFLFSANPGVPLRPLRETASGGELSRAMLAIRSRVTLGNDVETLIFDEVDTGIGGVTATALGERLARLAEATQIVCITHLPQLVAFADRHFAISKVTDAEAAVTQTVVQEVTGEARIAELCRMLGASPDDAAARSHAQALLERARRATV
jgi:DNA repair protein RecN (Recombination protein N)